MLERGFNLGYHPFPDSLEFPDFANCVSKTLHKKLIKPLDKLDLIMYIYIIETTNNEVKL